MKTLRDLIFEAVHDRLPCLTFYPPVDERKGLIELFESMIETPEQLDWLVKFLINRVARYPGAAEIRGIFCSHFRPKDGIEEYGEWRYKLGEESEAESIAECNAFKVQPPAKWLRQLAAGVWPDWTGDALALPSPIEAPPQPEPTPPPAPSVKSLAELERQIAEQAGQRTLTDDEKKARLIEIAAKLNLSTLPE